MTLRETKDDLIDALDEPLGVIAAGYPARQLGAPFEEAATLLEGLACCKLLLEMDPDRFHRDLVWAAFARRAYLTRCRAEGLTDHRMARSRCSGFFCAVAAGDLQLAAELGALSPPAWMPDGEYEDDFAWARYLHLLVAGADAAARAPLLAQMAAAQGKASPRLAIGEAFQAGDADAFEAAFTDLAAERNQRVDDDLPLFRDDPSYAPRAAIFVEGLALLRLAASAGLGPRRREYPRCPYVARASSLAERPEDIFDELLQVAGT